MVEVFILWTPHLALKVEDWREHSGLVVRAGSMRPANWRRCSLASHAFGHPADPFPEFTEQSPWIEAEAIGHPLLPEDRVVRNSVSIGGELRILVVSGSNMSGKSTLLRTLGVNVVLAQAGAPVRAGKLTISPLALGASIRVTDSLQGGVSRFYAEILRLRQILDLTKGPLPVLFLIDEFLHGTNSHDRRIGRGAGSRTGGARRHRADHHPRPCPGRYRREPAWGAASAFEDQIADGQIRFDYAMRPAWSARAMPSN